MKPLMLTPQELMEIGVQFTMEEVGGVLDDFDVRQIRYALAGSPPNMTLAEMLSFLKTAGLLAWPKELQEFALKTGYKFEM